ncbi:hypothetical protein ACFPH6_35535 [Streptomyces xiangluensis]|uniref:DUF8129 domain-containing protein n=1 Tax=Streptomyces xiangluensis TaxID=2665720 RepID=A0ABV8Z2W7_9ACTN
MSHTDRDTLPLPDYDHLPLGGVRTRIRALSADQVEQILAYERAHADRTPVVEVIKARLAELASGAEPTGGDPTAVRPEQSPQRAGRTVSPATAAEATHPPPHGTPDQRGRPKGNQT